MHSRHTGLGVQGTRERGYGVGESLMCNLRGDLICCTIVTQFPSHGCVAEHMGTLDRHSM